MKIILFLMNRIYILFVILGLGFFLLTNHSEAIGLAKLKTLNRVLPGDVRYLYELNREGAPIKEEALERFIFYYETVGQYVGYSSDLHDVLGFIHGRLGHHKEAQKHFEESILLNPHFFWAQYNLGILYLQQKEYAQAREQFKKALNTTPELAIAIFTQSKIYQQIFRFMDHPSQALEVGFVSGRKDCYRLMVLCQQLLASEADLGQAMDPAHFPVFLF